MTRVILLPVLHIGFKNYIFSRILGPDASPDVLLLTGLLSTPGMSTAPAAKGEGCQVNCWLQATPRKNTIKVPAAPAVKINSVKSELKTLMFAVKETLV